MNDNTQTIIPSFRSLSVEDALPTMMQTIDSIYTQTDRPPISTPSYLLASDSEDEADSEKEDEYNHNFRKMLFELKRTLSRLKDQIETLGHERMNNGCPVHDFHGLHVYGPHPRIVFKTINHYDAAGELLTSCRVPVLKSGLPITFLNETYWKNRWLEKKAKKKLLMGDHLKPDFYQNLLADITASGSWMYKRSTRKYITLPCCFNEKLNGLEVMCFPYILFNRIDDAKEEAMAWFNENLEVGQNFLAPIFELNNTTGHVFCVDQVSLVRERPLKRKSPSEEAKDAATQLRIRMVQSLQNRMTRLRLDDDGCEMASSNDDGENASIPPALVDECEKTYERDSKKMRRTDEEKKALNSVYGHASERKLSHRDGFHKL